MTPLRRRMIEDMRIRNLAPNTQRAYVEQVSRFARHFGKSPELLGPADIRTYQLHLTEERHLSASSLLVAVAAIRFLYKITPKRDWRIEEIIPTCRKPQRLPVVLSRDEVLRFLDAVEARKHRVILTVCYAAGLRISEAVRLTPTAIDSQRMIIRVDEGKGRKDRYVMLSPTLLSILRDYWRSARPKQWLFPGIRPTNRSRRAPSKSPAERPGSNATSVSRSRRTPCVMPLPSTCWKPEPICAPSSCCSAIAV